MSLRNALAVSEVDIERIRSGAMGLERCALAFSDGVRIRIEAMIPRITSAVDVIENIITELKQDESLPQVSTENA